MNEGTAADAQSGSAGAAADTAADLTGGATVSGVDLAAGAGGDEASAPGALESAWAVITQAVEADLPTEQVPVAQAAITILRAFLDDIATIANAA
jgi:hypothetical protein